jgi:hypothetical protein
LNADVACQSLDARRSTLLNKETLTHRLEIPEFRVENHLIRGFCKLREGCSNKKQREEKSTGGKGKGDGEINISLASELKATN